MKQEDFKELIEGIFGATEYPPSLRLNDNGTLSLVVSDMYDPISVNFDSLQSLAKLFGTEKIDTDSYQERGGCETCDYGSMYSVEFIVKEPVHLIELAKNWEQVTE